MFHMTSHFKFVFQGISYLMNISIMLDKLTQQNINENPVVLPSSYHNYVCFHNSGEKMKHTSFKVTKFLQSIYR